MTPNPEDPSHSGSFPEKRSDPLLRYVLILLAVIGTVTVLALGSSLLVLLFVAGIFSFLLLPFKHSPWAQYPGMSKNL